MNAVFGWELSVWSFVEFTVSRRFNRVFYKNSSGDEIADVNFFYNIAHVEASAYAH